MEANLELTEPATLLGESEWIDPWFDMWMTRKLSSSLQKFESNAQGGARRINECVLEVRASLLQVKRASTTPSLIAVTHTQVPVLGEDIVGSRRHMATAGCVAHQNLGSISLLDGDLRTHKALGSSVHADVVRAIAEPLLRSLNRMAVVSDDDWPAAE